MLRLTAALLVALRLIGSAGGFRGRLIADALEQSGWYLFAAISRASEPKPEAISLRRAYS